jgi:hypothetical protein
VEPRRKNRAEPWTPADVDTVDRGTPVPPASELGDPSAIIDWDPGWCGREEPEGTLRRPNQGRSPLPLERALSLAIQMADAHDKVHRNGARRHHRYLAPGV